MIPCSLARLHFGFFYVHHSALASLPITGLLPHADLHSHPGFVSSLSPYNHSQLLHPKAHRVSSSAFPCCPLHTALQGPWTCFMLLQQEEAPSLLHTWGSETQSSKGQKFPLTFGAQLEEPKYDVLELSAEFCGWQRTAHPSAALLGGLLPAYPHDSKGIASWGWGCRKRAAKCSSSSRTALLCWPGTMHSAGYSRTHLFGYLYPTFRSSSSFNMQLLNFFGVIWGK